VAGDAADAVRYTGVYLVRCGSHKWKAQISLGQVGRSVARLASGIIIFIESCNGCSYHWP
jgi:hypothetical protein